MTTHAMSCMYHFFLTDTLREAIDVAAAGVGKDWNKMYQQLPFNPPRNTQRRIQDIERNYDISVVFI